MKTIAFIGGGDWNDASVDILDIPNDMDIEKIKTEWRVWYDAHYVPSYELDKKPKFKTVIDFMLERGAVRSNIEEYEI